MAHLAAMLGAEKCLDLFIVKFKFQLSHKDTYGSMIEDYVEMYKKKNQGKNSIHPINSIKSVG